MGVILAHFPVVGEVPAQTDHFMPSNANCT